MVTQLTKKQPIALKYKNAVLEMANNAVKQGLIHRPVKEQAITISYLMNDVKDFGWYKCLPRNLVYVHEPVLFNNVVTIGGLLMAEQLRKGLIRPYERVYNLCMVISEKDGVIEAIKLSIK